MLKNIYIYFEIVKNKKLFIFTTRKKIYGNIYNESL